MQIKSIDVTDFIEKTTFHLFFSVEVKMTVIFQIFDPLVCTVLSINLLPPKHQKKKIVIKVKKA